MKDIKEHIGAAIVSDPPGVAYGRMYSMHKYWSKKPPDVTAAYIDRYTDPGDIVLDPFAGSGVVACEAVRLGRKAIAVDLNPMATFMTRVRLTPVNLSALGWAFRDVQEACEQIIWLQPPDRVRLRLLSAHLVLVFPEFPAGRQSGRLSDRTRSRIAGAA